MIESGWRGPKAFDDSFRNHGQRVSTMVGIAKALGYNGRVGAMQANLNFLSIACLIACVLVLLFAGKE